MTREDGTQHPLEPIINGGTRVTPTIIPVPYLCNNPAGALFQNMTCYVKGEQISNFHYAQPATTLYRMLYETKEEQKTVNSTNAINPVSHDDIDISAKLPKYEDAAKLAAKIGATGDISKLFISHMKWDLKNNQLNFENFVQIVVIFKFLFH